MVDERGGEGFGFDSIFEVKERGQTLAELSIDEKNSVYPRGVALKKLRDYLKER